MKSLHCIALVSLLAILALVAPHLGAQNAVSSGGLTGEVTDTSGAVLSGVRVEIRNLGTGLVQTTATGAHGDFRFPILPTGIYTVRFTHNGFSQVRADGIVVRIGETSTLNEKLPVGKVTQSVTVNAEGTTLDTTDTTVSTDVDQDLIQNLPLSGRRYTDFVLLTPNTSADGEFGLVAMGGQQGGGDSGYANGNGADSFTVDGGAATSNFFGDARGRTRVPYVFGEQSIQEFQVSDNPYSAAFGGAGSGFVNTVTKSGTNRLHGDAFYYNRNSGTGAEDAVDKGAGNPKPLDVLQQFGADLGGPLVRNKLFYYFDYEQQREKDPISVVNPPQQSLTVTSFGLPAGTTLPSPNGPLPVPGSDTAPDPNSPAYLQQVSNVLNAIRTNTGQRQRRRDDLSFFPKVDWQPTSKDTVTLMYNYNKFDSPGGEITYTPENFAGDEALSNNYVRDHQAGIHWVRTLGPQLLNDVHASYLRDQQIESPSGLIAANLPTIEMFGPQFFELGNPGFSLGNTLESEWELDERVNWVHGRNTLDLGVDFNYDYVRDFNFGNFRGTYAFSSPENFALGHYIFYSQAGGNPTFLFHVPYLGFYGDDTLHASRKLTLDLGLREDFQVYGQPRENPAFPLTGQFPNQYGRLAPRLGFAYAATPKTVVRGGFGVFYMLFNGVNYENSVISNGLVTQQSSAQLFFNSANAPNQQSPSFPNQLNSSGVFGASSNITVIDPHLHTPYVLQSSLQIEQQLTPATTLTVGTMWTHGIHLISSSAYDLNLIRPTGTTTYVVCPNGTSSSAASCAGPAFTGMNLDNGLLSDGAVDPNLGQINELISPGMNHYNSFFAKFQSRVGQTLNLLGSWTWSKNMDLNGVDFNNQWDFSNTHVPSLLDQRHRISFAGVWSPSAQRFQSHMARSALSGWLISTVMAFNSGRPYAPLLGTSAAAGDNLNDSAFNESTGNTADGLNAAGPSPNFGIDSFYGPWIDEVDMGLQRNFHAGEHNLVELKAQVFNLANHANYYVQNGAGINQIQYNPVGANCGDGVTQNQTCSLVPNSGPGNFQTLNSIDQLNGPRVFQFSFQDSF